MLKYLIIQLSDDSVSYCHYDAKNYPRTIDKQTLNNGIFWALKENLAVQFLYPKRVLSKEILKIIESIGHTNIVPSDIEDESLLQKADIIVVNDPSNIKNIDFKADKTYVLRTDLALLLDLSEAIKNILKIVQRLNVVITDSDRFDDNWQHSYKDFLDGLIPTIAEEFSRGHYVQLNLLTDRIMLDTMNNCNAGEELLTLAPDGKFYVCPAFYMDGGLSVGDLINGVDIPNAQLYKLTYAPICRNCEAYHCKRCVWMNKKLTLEVNTPSRQQCIISHVERNVSRDLLYALNSLDNYSLADRNIPEIDYLDPFDILLSKNRK